MKPIFLTGKEDKNAYDDIDTLAIDVSWVAKRHEHALGKRISTSDGRMSGHVYGAYRDISALVQALRPRRLAFCYDRGYSWRLELVPAYKQSRRAPQDLGQDNSHDQETSPGKDVERLFRGFPGLHLSLDDFEADDMVGYLASKFKGSGAMVVYSKDRDLFQLVDDKKKIGCLMPAKANKSAPKAKSKRYWVREAQVEEVFGVGAGCIAKLKALMGDPSDQIKGLKGAKKPGKKDALRAFAAHLSSDAYFDSSVSNPQLETLDWLVEPLMEERARLLANFQITSLPLAVSRIVSRKVVSGAQDDLSVELQEGKLATVLDVLAEFECESLMAQVDPLFQRFL